MPVPPRRDATEITDRNNQWISAVCGKRRKIKNCLTMKKELHLLHRIEIIVHHERVSPLLGLRGRDAVERGDAWRKRSSG